MGKRQKLSYNSDELAHHLQQSTGQGVDALFSPLSPPRSGTPVEQQGQTEQDKSKQTRKRARTRVPQPTGTTVPKGKSVQARTDVSMHARIAEGLKKGFLNRKHLSSFTFRFKTQELDNLDRVAAEVNREAIQKISKNDLVRLGLNWLLQDYEQNKENSVLACVVRRV